MTAQVDPWGRKSDLAPTLGDISTDASSRLYIKKLGLKNNLFSYSHLNVVAFSTPTKNAAAVYYLCLVFSAQTLVATKPCLPIKDQFQMFQNSPHKPVSNLKQRY